MTLQFLLRVLAQYYCGLCTQNCKVNLHLVRWHLLFRGTCWPLYPQSSNSFWTVMYSSIIWRLLCCWFMSFLFHDGLESWSVLLLSPLYFKRQITLGYRWLCIHTAHIQHRSFNASLSSLNQCDNLLYYAVGFWYVNECAGQSWHDYSVVHRWANLPEQAAIYYRERPLKSKDDMQFTRSI